jgi:tRNA (mo5U34)-methyltransferase
VKEKRIKLGSGSEIIVRLSDRRATQLTSPWPYRRLLKPVLNRMGGAATRPGHNGVATDAPQVPVILPRVYSMPAETDEQRALIAQIEGIRWYHTIDLGHGVRTPGAFDHEPALPLLHIPADLSGKRCLDVATLDGFFAFEMERRGAAEVMAIDIDSWLDLDMPPHIIENFKETGVVGKTGAGFAIASRILKSAVERRIRNVYDLTPGDFGMFDVVFAGAFMVHLSNPHRALQRIRSVTRGEALFMEPIVPGDSSMFGAPGWLFGNLAEGRWWNLSTSFFEKAMTLADFSSVEVCGIVDVRVRDHQDVPTPHVLIRAKP